MKSKANKSEAVKIDPYLTVYVVMGVEESGPPYFHDAFLENKAAEKYAEDHNTLWKSSGKFYVVPGTVDNFVKGVVYDNELRDYILRRDDLERFNMMLKMKKTSDITEPKNARQE
jgi:hypothetical protein